MDKLIDLIKGRLDKRNLGNSAKTAEVLYKANQIISKSVEGVKAYKLEAGTLFIAAPNSALSQELWGIQEALLNELRDTFGESKIFKIRIKSLTID